jgi:twitching motility protein PilT
MLNESKLATPSAQSTMLDALLCHTIKQGASDLHLRCGEPPFVRLAGELLRIKDHPSLTSESIDAMAEELLGQRGLARLDIDGSVDGAFTGPQRSRFRFNVFRQQNEISIAIRLLEESVRSLGELGLPESLYELTALSDGLVVVAGPTGAGKSTTLATMIDRINRQRSSHIVTIEDPIEYLHVPLKSLVNQRQVGIDAGSFQESLVASLRQDPDVILVGEIRDLNTIRTAITAAETGHLVLTTVHAGSAAGVIERLVSVFPADEQPGVRRQLAFVLKAVIYQQLILADGPADQMGAADRASDVRSSRRVVASEILRVNSAVANLIASGKSAQILSAMESGTAQGMQTFDQDLARLVHEGRLTRRTAAVFAQNPAIVNDRLQALHQHRAPSRHSSRGGQAS